MRRVDGAEISTPQRTVLRRTTSAELEAVAAEREGRRPVAVLYIGLDGRRGAAPRVGLAFFGLVICKLALATDQFVDVCFEPGARI